MFRSLYGHCENEKITSPYRESKANHLARNQSLRRNGDKSLAFPIFYLLFAAQPKELFLGWVKEVRTTKS
jgi:hypothetical protein